MQPTQPAFEKGDRVVSVKWTYAPDGDAVPPHTQGVVEEISTDDGMIGVRLTPTRVWFFYPNEITHVILPLILGSGMIAIPLDEKGECVPLIHDTLSKVFDDTQEA